MIKTVYFVPTTHHDLGYTRTIDDLLEAYVDYYDYILESCEKTENYPDFAKFRYSVEEFWSLDYYLSHTTAEKINKLKKYVKEGRIEISALYANIIDGICTPEEISRTFYQAKAFAEDAEGEITTVCLTDMPGMGDGTISALSKAGVKYLFAGFPKYFRWGDAQGNVPPLKHEYWDEYAINPW